MAKTSQVFARVEPETKAQAESILNQMGISMSHAVGMFLNQVVLQRGIPFDMRLPMEKPVVMGSLTKAQFDVEIQKGFDDAANGNIYSADVVEKEMNALYDV